MLMSWMTLTMNTMKNSDHLNLRKDVSSNTMVPKQNLIRIVKNKDGLIFVDPTKKANGRGVYIAPTREALERVKKTNALAKGLKVKIDPQFYAILEKEIAEN
jgi:predicted RNA-binding protein YlxR (DUF448 family)